MGAPHSPATGRALSALTEISPMPICNSCLHRGEDHNWRVPACSLCGRSRPVPAAVRAQSGAAPGARCVPVVSDRAAVHLLEVCPAEMSRARSPVGASPSSGASRPPHAGAGAVFSAPAHYQPHHSTVCTSCFFPSAILKSLPRDRRDRGARPQCSGTGQVLHARRRLDLVRVRVRRYRSLLRLRRRLRARAGLLLPFRAERGSRLDWSADRA